MNTKSSNKKADIITKFKSLLIEKNEKEGIEHDAYMLMAGYLSEIERLQQTENLTRKDLANKIRTSASYLTQVFRGDKPLNFYTLAKIQRALEIRFKVSAIAINNSAIYPINIPILTNSADNEYPKAELKNNYGFGMTIIQGGYDYSETA